MLIGLAKPVDSVNQIRNKTKASGLLAIAVNGDRRSTQRLEYKIRQGAAIIQAHARAIRIEDSHDMGVHSVMPVVRHSRRFREALGLIVNTAWPHGIHVAP